VIPLIFLKHLVSLSLVQLLKFIEHNCNCQIEQEIIAKENLDNEKYSTCIKIVPILNHHHNFRPSLQSCTLEYCQVRLAYSIEISNAIVEFSRHTISVQWNAFIKIILCHNTMLIWQIQLEKRSACNFAHVKGATNSIVVLNYFPVSIHWILGFATSIVHYALPHLKTEYGESENEKLVKYQDIAQLANRVKQSINQ